MAELYAACRINGNIVIKHVQLNNQVQQQVENIFRNQHFDFMAGISNEIAFTGDWKPDDDELLLARGLVEAQIFLNAINQNAIALQNLDANNFQNENVKALYIAIGQGQNLQILLQYFSPQQLLSRNFSLLHDGNVFRRINEPAFSLNNQLLATIDHTGTVRFKSFQMLRRVFDLSQFFQQATNADLNAFCGHASLSIADQNSFVAGADEGIRKFVHAISKENVLGRYTVNQIAHQANTIGFNITVQNNAIIVPSDKKEIKSLFSFLLDRVYLGSINQQLFITNSHRPL